MTFDILADVYVGMAWGWQTHHELAVKCRRCRVMSILKAQLKTTGSSSNFVAQNGAISELDGDVEGLFESAGFLSVGDLTDVVAAPAHLPDPVAAAFSEGATCMVMGCFNAAAAMFRLSLDLTTKPMLPDLDDQSKKQPSKRQRYNLADRIDWLIERRAIAPELSNLAHSVRQDANDGAHDGTLTKEDAEDLLDFTIAFYERHFTEPERLREAERRRLARRGRDSEVSGDMGGQG